MNDYYVGQLYETTPKFGFASGQKDPEFYIEALDESECIDVRISLQRSRAGMLLDTRFCGGLRGANAALVVLTGVGQVSWQNDGELREHPWHARYGKLSLEKSAWVKAGTTLATARDDHLWALDVDNPATALSAGAVSATPGQKHQQMPEYVVTFGSLLVSALRVLIYVGHIDDLDSAPPDMTELSDEHIIAGFAQWSSVMSVHQYCEWQ